MYIRRKVFSIAEDMYGDERYFSTTDIDLGFSDYDDNFYDERLYAEDEGLSTGAKVGLGVAGTAATTAGAIYAAKKGWLGKKAQGWYESGASKLKNMFSKEGAKAKAKAVSEENKLVQNFVKTHGTNQRSKFIRKTDNQINKLKDQLALMAKQHKSATPEGRLEYSLQMKGERAYSDMYDDDYWF